MVFQADLEAAEAPQQRHHIIGVLVEQVRLVKVMMVGLQFLRAVRLRAAAAGRGQLVAQHQ
jgi:hypothetical protein